jgi:hypothetical protein
MEDLQGDGTGAQLSSALRQLKGHTYKAMPTAVIAGFYRSDGLPPDDHFLDKLGQIANAACLAKVHSVNSILLANFYGAGWLAMMGGLNDGIVPVTSALELEPATLDVNFFRGIHGPGTSPLFGYIPPTLLDGTAVPNRVIQLLNTTPRNEDFRRFGQQ